MDSNPRPQPWQGCALPLSYTRVASTKSGGMRLSRTAERWYNPSLAPLQEANYMIEC